MSNEIFDCLILLLDFILFLLDFFFFLVDFLLFIIQLIFKLVDVVSLLPSDNVGQIFFNLGDHLLKGIEVFLKYACQFFNQLLR